MQGLGRGESAVVLWTWGTHTFTKKMLLLIEKELEGAYIFTLTYSKILFKDLGGGIKEE